MKENHIDINNLITWTKNEVKKIVKQETLDHWRKNATDKGIPIFYTSFYDSIYKKPKYNNNEKGTAITHFWKTGCIEKWIINSGMACRCKGSLINTEHILDQCPLFN